MRERLPSIVLRLFFLAHFFAGFFVGFFLRRRRRAVCGGGLSLCASSSSSWGWLSFVLARPLHVHALLKQRTSHSGLFAPTLVFLPIKQQPPPLGARSGRACERGQERERERRNADVARRAPAAGRGRGGRRCVGVGFRATDQRPWKSSSSRTRSCLVVGGVDVVFARGSAAVAALVVVVCPRRGVGGLGAAAGRRGPVGPAAHAGVARHPRARDRRWCA